jgi:hypothetical protein
MTHGIPVDAQDYVRMGLFWPQKRTGFLSTFPRQPAICQ